MRDEIVHGHRRRGGRRDLCATTMRVPVLEEDLSAIVPMEMTATEVTARQQWMYRARPEYTEYRADHTDPRIQDWARHPALAAEMDRFFERSMAELMGGIGGEDVGSAEAREKGMRLFKEALTPEQRDCYDKNKYIEVVGGETGRRYRINDGRQMNILLLDKKGKPAQKLCFLPQGQLVKGDVMLAQKIALETFERDALKVANKFAV